jgi:Fe-S-cluster-containing dehydrogenase component
MQCKNAACLTVCPTGATYKREDGIVMIDDAKCIGCKYCIAACPYGARTYIENIQSYFEGEVGVSQLEQVGYAQYVAKTVAKCEFCAVRLDQSGYQPACVVTCPAIARTFGDVGAPDSKISQLIKTSNAVQLLPEMGTDPSVYYIPPKQQTTWQRTASASFSPVELKILGLTVDDVAVIAGAAVAIGLGVHVAKRTLTKKEGGKEETAVEQKQEVRNDQVSDGPIDQD